VVCRSAADSRALHGSLPPVAHAVRTYHRTEAETPAPDDDGNVEITGRDLREKAPLGLLNTMAI
jgi:hypothetical protein